MNCSRFLKANKIQCTLTTTYSELTINNIRNTNNLFVSTRYERLEFRQIKLRACGQPCDERHMLDHLWSHL